LKGEIIMTKHIWKCNLCDQEFDTTEPKDQKVVECEWGTEVEFTCPRCNTPTWSMDATYLRSED
jgi:transcription elongation factor Elf1